MKAKEYAQKMNEVGAELVGEVVNEFAQETRDLIDKRTQYSNDAKSALKGTKNWAVDGVLREQRQKWDAICRQTSLVQPGQFDVLIVEHLNDVALSQQVWKQKLQEKETPKQEKVVVTANENAATT